MSRYFYYHIVLVALLNLMLFVPHILIRYRFSGALTSMAISVVVGTGLCLMFTSIMCKYPGQGLPEILNQFLPRSVTLPFMIFMAVMWIIGPSIAVVSYAVLINRFINPDTSPILVLVLLCVVCLYAATRPTMTIIFLIEMGLVLNLPLILFILFKAVRNDAINWDAIHTVANYWTQMPKWNAIGAATYIFTGYVNLAVYNRAMPPNVRIRHRWTIPLVGLLVLAMTFFVPIGFHGTETVDEYLYVWSLTADSMIMSYGFIERVIFVFLIMYLNLTLIYTASGWHQAIEFLKGLAKDYKPDIDGVPMKKAGVLIGTAIVVATVLYLYLFNEKITFQLSEYWLGFRLIVEIATVGFLFMLVRKGKTRS
ncbi:hypothetical protein [Paenibacillus xanthanilyticus]|uniref:Spore germination protein n=1 Tax=Paenibacillus xanthanilyticus TaxID=1783531 RepID=A0ABV8K9S6_9BACL